MTNKKIIETERVCRKCNELKNIEHFQSMKKQYKGDTNTYYRYSCTECYKKYRREYYKKYYDKRRKKKREELTEFRKTLTYSTEKDDIEALTLDLN